MSLFDAPENSEVGEFDKYLQWFVFLVHWNLSKDEAVAVQAHTVAVPSLGVTRATPAAAGSTVQQLGEVWKITWVGILPVQKCSLEGIIGTKIWITYLVCNR